MRPSDAIDAVATWAAGDENVRVMLVTGSAARDASELDEFSDVDIELYAVDPRPLLDDSAWYERFGDVLVVEALPNPGRHPTRLVYYVDGKIDFTIAPVDELRAVARDRSFVVVVDKDDVAGALDSSNQVAAAPTHDEIRECINWFYAAALMEVKLVARHQLWLAKFREWDLMRQLLRMIEWDHRTRYGWDYDTWYNGKNIGAWADDDIRSEAERCWGPYDEDGMMAAVDRAVALFDTLAGRVVAAVGAPQFDHGKARRAVAALKFAAQ